MKTTCLFLLGLAFCWGLSSCTAQQPKPEEVIEIINRVNNYWPVSYTHLVDAEIQTMAGGKAVIVTPGDVAGFLNRAIGFDDDCCLFGDSDTSTGRCV